MAKPMPVIMQVRRRRWGHRKEEMWEEGRPLLAPVMRMVRVGIVGVG